MNKCAILSLSTENHKWMYDITNKTKSDYCKTHGIDFIFVDHVLDNTKSPTWSKIPLCIDNLGKYDFIMWMDDDAFIINQNFNFNILTETLDKSGKFLLASKDWNGLNAGVFMIKNNTRAFDMLYWIWENYSASLFYCEQQRIWDYIKENDNVWCDQIPHKILNGYTKAFHPQFTEYLADKDSFIAHLAGGERTKSNIQNTKFEIMRYINGFR